MSVAHKGTPLVDPLVDPPVATDPAFAQAVQATHYGCTLCRRLAHEHAPDRVPRALWIVDASAQPQTWIPKTLAAVLGAILLVETPAGVGVRCACRHTRCRTNARSVCRDLGIDRGDIGKIGEAIDDAVDDAVDDADADAARDCDCDCNCNARRPDKGQARRRNLVPVDSYRSGIECPVVLALCDIDALHPRALFWFVRALLHTSRDELGLVVLVSHKPPHEHEALREWAAVSWLFSVIDVGATPYGMRMRHEQTRDEEAAVRRAVRAHLERGLRRDAGSTGLSLEAPFSWWNVPDVAGLLRTALSAPRPQPCTSLFCEASGPRACLQGCPCACHGKRDCGNDADADGYGDSADAHGNDAHGNGADAQELN